MLWATVFSQSCQPELTLLLFSQNVPVRWLLLDVEGTTTPVDFVYKTLFPFAAEQVVGYLRRHSADSETTSLLEDLRRGHAAEWTDHPAIGPWLRRTSEEEIASAAKYARHLIAQDRKVTALKTLQGMIWEEGYRTGELKGQVYEDVPRAFELWKKQGKRIAIFSSGSVLAQKLLFEHSNAGDLTVYIDGYFDTTTGSKREAASYKAIGNALGAATRSMLFVSDVAQELDAAHDAGMYTALIVRPGSSRAADSQHACIESFDQLLVES